MMRPGMMIVGLIVLVLVIVGIVFLVRALVHAGRNGKNLVSTPPAPPSVMADNKALQILDERLARGEISPEEYRQRKDELLK
ncbi:MAG TPA: hypothetical protein DCM45_07015 [Clostridiales bacterium]|nr:hypothetical protein [Clostridiales bacterium]